MASRRSQTDSDALEQRSGRPLPHPFVKVRQRIQVERRGSDSRKLSRLVDQKGNRSQKNTPQSRIAGGAVLHPHSGKAKHSYRQQQDGTQRHHPSPHFHTTTPRHPSDPP